MKLFLVKPDLMYYEEYNDMMKEWIGSSTQIAPWFLGKPFDTIEKFAELIQDLDELENANQDKQFSSTTSYFVIDEKDRLIGAASLRHYLTVKGLKTWGHCGYGVRPSERNKGYGTEILKLLLAEAKNKKIYRVLVGAHKSNVASRKVIEKCKGVLENTVTDPDDADEQIDRFWIDNKK
ncbi:GNAT family N-acetyltransferase [Candidatus Saccharibacteria bacterium]|nr:GNAT family N-acetyltransferase [Candidatus Saccharibacteria bacterium]